MSPEEQERSKWLAFADLLDKCFPASHEHERPGGDNIRTLLADRDRLASDLQETRAELERVRRNHLRRMHREALDWADRMIWDIPDEWVLRNRPRLLDLASRIRAALATMETGRA